MMNHIHHRRGFTLIEILVAMALTIFLLSILAEAFILGSDMFRTLKSVGDLNDGLRTVANMMRTDLAADHFEGKRRLSDTKFWIDGPPQQGYFVVYRDPNPLYNPPIEGTDADGIPCSRSAGSVLAFTSKARGNRPQDYYSTVVPAGPLSASAILMPPDSRYQPPADARGQYFSSQWIEVCWFLSPVALQGAKAAGTPLYALYRQQRLVVGAVDQLNWGSATVPVTQLTSYNNKVSCQPNRSSASSIYFNSPSDLTIPNRRTAGVFPPQALTSFQPLVDPTTGQLTAEDMVLQDVISFDVKVFLAGATDFVAYPYYDTWSRRHDDAFDYSTKVPPMGSSPPQILAVEITIRVWDPKTQVTRQVTIVQDM